MEFMEPTRECRWQGLRQRLSAGSLYFRFPGILCLFMMTHWDSFDRQKLTMIGRCSDIIPMQHRIFEDEYNINAYVFYIALPELHLRRHILNQGVVSDLVDQNATP